MEVRILAREPPYTPFSCRLFEDLVHHSNAKSNTAKQYDCLQSSGNLENREFSVLWISLTVSLSHVCTHTPKQ